MDKLNIWLLSTITLLNVILVVALSALILSGPFRDNAQEDSVRFLTQLGSELKDGKKILSPSEQTLLVKNFQSVVKAQSEVQVAGAEMFWSLIKAIVISLILQVTILVRLWRNRSEMMLRPLPGSS
ncbi:MAG: hypothetical protein V3T88_03455 [Nitrosomonadaceae bacterium]